MKRTAIFSSIALITNFGAVPGYAACAYTPDSAHSIVRGRFLRCEDASFYLESSGAYQRYEQDLEAAVSRVGPENRETLLERLGVTPEFPYDDKLEGRIVVVSINSHALIAPWIPGTTEAVEFKGPAREFYQIVRYWWRGSIEACEAMAELSPVDFWVYSECCDTPTFGAPVCLIGMEYAEPATNAMREGMSQALEGL